MPRKLKQRIVRKIDRQLHTNDVEELQYLYSMIDPLIWGWPENIMQ